MEKQPFKNALYDWRTILLALLSYFAIVYMLIPTFFSGGVAVSCSTNVKTGLYDCVSVVPPWYLILLGVYLLAYMLIVMYLKLFTTKKGLQ